MLKIDFFNSDDHDDIDGDERESIYDNAESSLGKSGVSNPLSEVGQAPVMPARPQPKKKVFSFETPPSNEEDRLLVRARARVREECKHLEEVPELMDTDIEEDMLLELEASKDKKALYHTLVRKANGLSGIRRLHRLFKDQRRTLIGDELRRKITEEYFKVCAEFIPLLEELRQANFDKMACLLKGE